MNKFLITMLVFFSVSSAQAFMTEFYVFSGYGQAKHAGESKSPDMLANAIGATVAFDILAGIHVGLSADYRFYNQLSDVKDPYGNRTGKRLAISPTVTFSLGTIAFKYMYQMNGDYELTNETSSGNKVTYTDVSGHSFFISMPFMTTLRLGVFYEMEKYSKYNLDSTNVDLEAADNELEFDKYGLFLSVIY